MGRACSCRSRASAAETEDQPPVNPLNGAAEKAEACLLPTARLTFKDGTLVQIEGSEGGRTFLCAPAKNVGQHGCAGGS